MSAFGLLRTRRFLPLFATQFLGALNDNLFKNAMVVLVLYRSTQGGPVLVAIAGGVFILPYVLFSAPAGALADGFDKARLIRITKLAEVALMLVAAVALASGSVALLLAVLFGLGAQATFFGPLKYAILPDHLAPAELLAGNGLVEAGTFVAILAGTIAGSALILRPDGVAMVAGLLLGLALLGVAAGFAVRPAPPAGRTGVSIRIVADTIRLVAHARAVPRVWRAVLGISWFWTLGSVFLAEFPVIVRQTFDAGGEVVSLLLGCFAVGIGAGSMLAARLLRGVVSARLAPAAAALLSVFALDFAWACAAITPGDGWHAIGPILADPRGWRVLGDLVAVAVCGGVFSMPLYGILQTGTPAAQRARTVAANNVVNALFIVAGAAVAAVLPALGVSAPAIIALAAAANLAVAARAWRLRARRGQDGLAGG